MGKVWCRIRFAVRTQIRESGTKMSQFGLARPGFWILNECMVNTLKVTEIRRHFWIRNNIFQCKLKPEVDNRHLSLNSILIDSNWRKRSKHFEQSMSKPIMVKLSTCRPKTISFWLWSHYDTKMMDGFVILFFYNQFFLRLEKNTFRGGCFSYLGTKKKSPWTWSSASLERGSGVWVGRVEVQLAPSPEKKKQQQQQQQQQHRTTSSSTTSTTTTIEIKKTIKTLLCSSEEEFF